VKRCFVEAFQNYPLFTYLIRDSAVREEFLDKYMDANYDVCVLQGSGVLFVLTIEDHTSNGGRKVIGGVITIPPAVPGQKTTPYNGDSYSKAYEKYGLSKISEEALQRVLRFESWEEKTIDEKLTSSGIPVAFALLCAIKPEYSNNGIGRLVFKEAVRLLKNVCVQQNKEVLKNTKNLIMDAVTGTKKEYQYPLFITTSYCGRSAKFHKNNGFQTLKMIPYFGEENGLEDPNNNPDLYVHLLACDPFKTGKMNEMKCLFDGLN